jgi:hypothetical protein
MVLPNGVEGMSPPVKELPPCLQESWKEQVEFKVDVSIKNAANRVLKFSKIALRGVVDDQGFDIVRNRFGEPSELPIKDSTYKVKLSQGCMTQTSFKYSGRTSWQIDKPSGGTLTTYNDFSSNGSYEVEDPLRESIRSCAIMIIVDFKHAGTPGENPEIFGRITCLSKQLVIKKSM